MSEFSQTVPELVAWARKNDFSISLPVDRLSFLLAIATLNGERLNPFYRCTARTTLACAASRLWLTLRDSWRDSRR